MWKTKKKGPRLSEGEGCQLYSRQLFRVLPRVRSITCYQSLGGLAIRCCDHWMVTTELLPTYIVHSPQGLGYIGSIYSAIAINFLKSLSTACNTFKIEPLVKSICEPAPNPCSGPPTVYKDFSMYHDWPIKKAIIDLLFSLKGNLKHNFGYLNKDLGVAFQMLLARDLLSTKCSLLYPFFLLLSYFFYSCVGIPSVT